MTEQRIFCSVKTIIKIVEFEDEMDRRYRQAAERFIETYKINPCVVGILMTGSVVHATPDKNSDVDIAIVLNKASQRTRGNTWVDGIEIEYFINPVRQIRKYFQDEKEGHTAHMFSHGVILYQRGTIMDALVREAKSTLRRKPAPMSRVSKELARYHLDDALKDLEDVYLRHDWVAFERIRHTLLDECVGVFYEYHRVRPEKSKRLQEHLTTLDAQFAKLYASAILAPRTAGLKPARRVVAYLEQRIGKRPKDWHLTGPLTS